MNWWKRILHNEGRPPAISALDIWRAVLHLPVGVITILACQLGWIYGFIFAAGFMIYELNEDMHLTDKAYKDIFGWLLGMGFTIIGLLILQR